MLLFGVGFLALGYVFFVHQTVFLVVERENAEKEITELSGEISTLESRQIALSSKITRETALLLGYRETKTTFVPRRSLSSAGSLGAAGASGAANAAGSIVSPSVVFAADSIQ